MRSWFVVGGVVSALGALVGLNVVMQEMNYGASHKYSDLTGVLESLGDGIFLVGLGAAIACFAAAFVIGRRGARENDDPNVYPSARVSPIPVAAPTNTSPGYTGGQPSPVPAAAPAKISATLWLVATNVVLVSVLVLVLTWIVTSKH
jgi:hypothetical protein